MLQLFVLAFVFCKTDRQFELKMALDPVSDQSGYRFDLKKCDKTRIQDAVNLAQSKPIAPVLCFHRHFCPKTVSYLQDNFSSPSTP